MAGPWRAAQASRVTMAGSARQGYNSVSMALRVQARAARQDNNKAAGKAPTGRSAQEAMT
ncbi:hypothetical protein B7G55_00745 [Aeromonas hydrophila]|nr:hypothetical protein B7G55_00745 [Aeromonas hydrophila]POV89946.1 hypothetical protein C3395_06215 [Aeromonas sp. ASNIH6]